MAPNLETSFPQVSAPDPKQKLRDFFSAFFFAALFFLCCADQFFATRIHGFNFRWGQLLLLLISPFAIINLRAFLRQEPSEAVFYRKILFGWAVFFFFFGLSAVFSVAPSHTFLKWGWGLFNIAGAALVCLSFRKNDALSRGFASAIIVNALVIFIDSIFLQCLGLDAPFGGGQPRWIFRDFTVFRPQAFYYEPSYAASALSFAFPLIFLKKDWPGWVRSLAGALLLSCVFFISSRTGMAGVTLSLFCVLSVAVFKKNTEILKLVGAALLGACLILGAFILTPGGARYFGLMDETVNVTAINGIAKTGAIPDSSEGLRLVNFIEAYKNWKKHPVLGSGVLSSGILGSKPGRQFGSVDQKLPPSMMNTWMELAVESGALGLMAFLLAVGLTIRSALQGNKTGFFAIFAIAAWAAHFLINLNFTQTFPRLDYWLLFFFSVRLLITGKKQPGT